MQQTLRKAADVAERGGAEALSAWAEKRLAAEPRCPVASYLLGCYCLDRGRPARGARLLMVASHAEPRLESAALLVLAGLRWTSYRNLALLTTLLQTWELFRRPEFDRTRIERRMFDLFAPAEERSPTGSRLAERLARLPIPCLRAQIREALRSRDAELGPWLLLPA